MRQVVGRRDGVQTPLPQQLLRSAAQRSAERRLVYGGYRMISRGQRLEREWERSLANIDSPSDDSGRSVSTRVRR